MTRKEAREQAFALLFEKTFSDSTMEEIIDNAVVGRELQVDPYTKNLVSRTLSHLEEIDSIIEPNLRKWSKNRISRVALSALRGAVCEILYDREIPESVSINEAVEIVKKFSGKEEASFVNGVLGSIVKTLSVQTDGEH
ncbi:MAG TPA: transcription antitermination factor NusB [Firmicutes bacterium]|nr:transcription antitermination factor NusB [Bacillota bacterium]